MDFTPHSIFSCLLTFSEVVAPIISDFGLNFEMDLVVYPEVVAVIMAFAFKSLAMVQVLLPIAFVIVFEISSIFLLKISSKSMESSVTSKIFLMVITDSIGYFPLAVSPLNITQDVPSSTAFATSFASALVGRGFLIIESSIWVAVMTTFPFSLHFLIMFFCAIGTFSVSISTPRSPLATIIPSEASIISSKFSSPSLDSILEMILIS